MALKDLLALKDRLAQAGLTEDLTEDLTDVMGADEADEIVKAMHHAKDQDPAPHLPAALKASPEKEVRKKIPRVVEAIVDAVMEEEGTGPEEGEADGVEADGVHGDEEGHHLNFLPVPADLI